MISRNALLRPSALTNAVIAELPEEGSCDVDMEPWTLQLGALSSGNASELREPTLGLTTTLVHLAIWLAASQHLLARSGINPSQLLDDDDFKGGLKKMIRKTVRDYCTVGKRNGIDC